MAVGIIFNVEITARLAAHEGFHACYYMMDRLGIVLSDYSDEAWAYLIGWIADCIDKFNNEENDCKGVRKDVLKMHYVDGDKGCVEMMDLEVEKTDIAE